MEFICPKCKCITNAKVERRKDKPKEEPKYPADGGHWRLLAYELDLKVYEWDHWNRTIVCANCASAHHYWIEGIA